VKPFEIKHLSLTVVVMRWERNSRHDSRITLLALCRHGGSMSITPIRPTTDIPFGDGIFFCEGNDSRMRWLERAAIMFNNESGGLFFTHICEVARELLAHFFEPNLAIFDDGFLRLFALTKEILDSYSVFMRDVETRCQLGAHFQAIHSLSYFLLLANHRSLAKILTFVVFCRTSVSDA